MNLDRIDIDTQAKEHAYLTASPEIVRYEILMRRYNWTMNTWSAFMQRHSNTKVWRRGSVLRFKGTREQFDKLHDKLTANESNGKIIGIYNGWSEMEN